MKVSLPQKIAFVLLFFCLAFHVKAQIPSQIIPDQRIGAVITGEDYDTLLLYPEKILKLNFELHYSYSIIAGPFCSMCAAYDTSTFNVLKYEDKRAPDQTTTVNIGDYILLLFSRNQVESDFKKYYHLPETTHTSILEKH